MEFLATFLEGFKALLYLIQKVLAMFGLPTNNFNV